MQKFSLHYHSFVLIMALYHSVRKIILCWLAAAVTEITTQQYYFQHFRNMLHECPCPSAFLDFVKQAAFSCSQNHATSHHCYFVLYGQNQVTHSMIFSFCCLNQANI